MTYVLVAAIEFILSYAWCLLRRAADADRAISELLGHDEKASN